MKKVQVLSVNLVQVDVFNTRLSPNVGEIGAAIEKQIHHRFQLIERFPANISFYENGRNGGVHHDSFP